MRTEEQKNKRVAYVKQWSLNHKEQVYAASTKWRAAHPQKHKEVNRTAKLFLQYGLTIEAYYALLGEQNGLCANPACRKINEGGYSSWSLLCVDHVHIEGYKDLPPEEKAKLVRGLLCSKCNAGIGYFDDNLALLSGAITYLGKNASTI